MTGWLADALVDSALLLAVVLLVRKPVARMFGASASYALWLAPALRMALPPLPSAPELLPAGLGQSSATYLLTYESAASAAIPLAKLLLVLWAAGAVAYLLIQWRRHQRFVTGALLHGRPFDVAGCPYQVVATRGVDGPVASGLIHPLILVPSDFQQRFTPDQQRLALLHEQLHHRRGDLWASAAAVLFVALHWFNPLAHVAVRAFRRDMEAACDASVIEREGRQAAPAYAETIIQCAMEPAPRTFCALTSIDELKGRVKMLKLNHGAARRFAGLVLAGALAAGGAATAGAAQDKPATETREFVKKIEIRKADGEKDVLIRRDGKGPHVEMQCPGEKFEAGSARDAADKKEHVRFVLCAAKGESLLAALEKAEAEIQKRDEMPADRKAEILSQIRAKIAELRSRG